MSASGRIKYPHMVTLDGGLARPKVGQNASRLRAFGSGVNISRESFAMSAWTLHPATGPEPRDTASLVRQRQDFRQVGGILAPDTRHVCGEIRKSGRHALEGSFGILLCRTTNCESHWKWSENSWPSVLY